MVQLTPTELVDIITAAKMWYKHIEVETPHYLKNVEALFKKYGIMHDYIIDIAPF